MKKSLFATMILLLTFCFSGCENDQKEKLISDLTKDDISQITILALTTGTMVKITDAEQIADILETVKSLHLYAKLDKKSEYTTDLIQFSIKKISGEEITVALLTSKIIYNNEWYSCDQVTCTQLSDLAYEYLSN